MNLIPEYLLSQVGALDIVADCHNDMAREMLPVEEPLLAGTLSKMASLLKRGASELTWKSPASAVDGFVGECSTLVRGAHEQLFALKGHLRDIANDLESWSREPLFTRKPKPMSVDEFEAVFRGVRTARYAAITEGGKVIDKKLREAAVLMRVPRSSPIWAGYVDFVQGVVIQGLTQLVAVSLRRLNEVLSHDHGAALLLGSDGSGSSSLSTTLHCDVERGVPCLLNPAFHSTHSSYHNCLRTMITDEFSTRNMICR